MCTPVRGGIYFVNLPHKENSSIQSGFRPCLCISNSKNCQHSTVQNVLVCTSRVHKKRDLPVHIYIDNPSLPKASIVMCEQIQMVDTSDLENARFLGVLTEDEMKRVEKGLKIQLAID